LFSYPVSSDVGKVSNNSPELIVPLDSKKSDYGITSYLQKEQEIKDDTNKKMEQNEEDGQKDEGDVSIVPEKRSSDILDNETTNEKSERSSKG